MSEIRTVTLENGLTLLLEPMSGVSSVALHWLLPAGSATDTHDGEGVVALLGEMLFRGAGGMSSREHSDALDRLGVRRSNGVSAHHLRLSVTMVGDQLAEALPLITSMVTAPTLDEQSLDPVRRLCIQELDSLDDEPQHAVLLKLGARLMPPPYNRHGYGRREVLESATIEQVREAWRQRFKPQGAILGIAGAFDPDAVVKQLNDLFRDWTGRSDEPERVGDAARGHEHVTQPTAQVHLAMGFDAPPERDPQAVLERIAISVLSGGTSGRLFTEVRQKRSLCYSVYAQYRPGRDEGLITLYAGTTPERAAETLAVCQQEIDRLSDGAEDAEFQRAIIGLKSHLVMSGESTSARASAIARDYFRLGRPRTLEEVTRAIEAVDRMALNAYLAERNFGAGTVVTIGPEPIAASETVASAAPQPG